MRLYRKDLTMLLRVGTQVWVTLTVSGDTGPFVALVLTVRSVLPLLHSSSVLKGKGTPTKSRGQEFPVGVGDITSRHCLGRTTVNTVPCLP